VGRHVTSYETNKVQRSRKTEKLRQAGQFGYLMCSSGGLAI